MVQNTTFTFLAPNPYQQFDTQGSAVVYSADAYGIIKSVPLSAVNSLLKSGCINLGATASIGDGAGWNWNNSPEVVVAAAGLTQGAATKITGPRVRTTCTTSSEGVILLAIGTSAATLIRTPGTKGVKVYPPVGYILDAGSTNAAQTLVAGKAAIYTQRSDSQHFDTFKGA